jgi:site-specific DNA-adenine methylase
VRNFVDPFLGSLAVLLGRPTPFVGTETVNDLDGFICNFWRAVKADPEAVVRHADWPVNEVDLIARHVWLVHRRDTLTARLESDPEFFDAKLAGWWVWGACSWIGSGWCSGKGPWNFVEAEDGSRKLVHLGDAGRGVNRKLVHLGNAGRGVNRKLVHLGNAGRGVEGREPQTGAGDGSEGLAAWIAALSDRLKRVRVCCGDWTRVCGPTPTVKMGLTAIVLDPPYADSADRTDDLYAKDSNDVAHAVREWAIEHGDDPRIRIALCGYEGEHAMPDSWECVAWKAKGGYGSQARSGDNANARRERIWFSSHCLKVAPKASAVQTGLFDGLDD